MPTFAVGASAACASLPQSAALPLRRAWLSCAPPTSPPPSSSRSRGMDQMTTEPLLETASSCVGAETHVGGRHDVATMGEFESSSRRATHGTPSRCSAHT
eukprot:6211081-Pleurochrysis_carterae.AAC.8